jgi:hypothetical protein
MEEGEWLANHPLKQRDICANGFFQKADLYIHFRPWLRSLFTTDNTDLLRYDVRVCDLMAAKGIDTCGTVLHLRLDDFQAAKQVLHPRVFLTKLLEANTPLTIVVQKPTKPEEWFYLAMFDSPRPTLISSSVLEDHATLRRARRLMTSNSTFAWTAAFLGEAEERFIAPLLEAGQDMGRIADSDTLLPIEYLNLDTYKVAKYAACFSGEDIQGLCDYTVLDREKREYHRGLPLDNQLLLQEAWHVPKSVHAISVYADSVGKSVEAICAHFESVALLIIHNGDTEPPVEHMMRFLDAYPKAHIYAQNNVVAHPRIHSLPMGIQNRMWRDIEIGEIFPAEKVNLVFASHFGATHPSRSALVKTLIERPFPGLLMPRRCSQYEYFAHMVESMYSMCPPGNAHDTHRMWESLYCGATPIVLRTPFIERLLETCPGLPLRVVEGFELLEVPPPIQKVSAHPVYLHLDYWRQLFSCYKTLAHA